MSTTRSTTRWLLALAGSAALLVLSPGLALSQEFQKVEGPLRPELPATPFVATAYGFIWIAVLVYVLFVARGLSNVRKDLAELRKKLDGAGPRP
jgi:short subunit fatty acids transporter